MPEGTSVKSVEAGTVIYAGNELQGYGNLVLIRHAGGWVSAYAHNEDPAGQAWRYGAPRRSHRPRRHDRLRHPSPQVHFELRMGAKPVNPLDYLAPGRKPTRSAT
ncbi:MAG: M23 family metallopeptidase [Bauldia sp.]